jgi:hypothetical protein
VQFNPFHVVVCQASDSKAYEAVLKISNRVDVSDDEVIDLMNAIDDKFGISLRIPDREYLEDDLDSSPLVSAGTWLRLFQGTDQPTAIDRGLWDEIYEAAFVDDDEKPTEIEDKRPTLRSLLGRLSLKG